MRIADGLCPQCANINFDEILIRPSVGRFAHKARRWDKKNLSDPSKLTCPLCAFVAKLIIKTPETESMLEGFVTLVPRPFALDLSLCLVENGNPRKAEEWTLRHPLNPEVLKAKEAERTEGQHSSFSGVYDANIHELPYGRSTATDVIDTNLIASWLHNCEKRHGCEAILMDPVKEEAVPMKIDDDFVLRVLDVATSSVIDAPPGCRYAALSYVWGDMELSKLTKHLIPSTQGYVSVFRESENLPRSIADAIHLCQELGIDYLWVDCLCILQHDAHDKHIQISNMDRIYRLAHLTIVSAAGADANAGLPGVNPKSRQPKQQRLDLRSLSLLVTNRSLKDVAKSYWYSRGWTFQEFLLSRRLLIFTEEQALFICREAVWMEDTVLEEESRSQIAAVQLPIELGILSAFQLNNLADKSAFEVFEGIYSPAATIFAQRNLSRELDALDAFSGIQKALEPFLGPFFWGLPIRLLWVGLCWEYMLPSELDAFCSSQRPDTIPQTRLQKKPGFLSFELNSNVITNHRYRRRPGFPSWTWAGYDFEPSLKPTMHDFHMLKYNNINSEKMDPIIDIYAFDGLGQKYCLLESMSKISPRLAESLFKAEPEVLSLHEICCATGSGFNSANHSLLILQGSVAFIELKKEEYYWSWDFSPYYGYYVHWKYNIPADWLGEDPKVALVAMSLLPGDPQKPICVMMVHFQGKLAYRVPIPCYTYLPNQWSRFRPRKSTILLA